MPAVSKRGTKSHIIFGGILLTDMQTCILFTIKLGFAVIQLRFCALQVRNNSDFPRSSELLKCWGSTVIPMEVLLHGKLTHFRPQKGETPARNGLTN